MSFGVEGSSNTNAIEGKPLDHTSNTTIKVWRISESFETKYKKWWKWKKECLPKGEVFNVTIIILSSCYWLFRFMIFAPNLKTSGSYTFLLNISLGTLYFSMHLHSQTQKQKAKQERLKEQKTKTKNILDEKNKNFTNWDTGKQLSIELISCWIRVQKLVLHPIGVLHKFFMPSLVL